MFLELNLADGRRVLVNTGEIVSLSARKDAKGTEIRRVVGELMNVQETYDELKALISDGYEIISTGRRAIQLPE